jgi:hypothetical protein
LRAEKTAFSSRAAFIISLQWIAVPPVGKNRGMSSIDSRGSILPFAAAKLPRTDPPVVGYMSVIGDADAA